jgi:hypothetical protein
MNILNDRVGSHCGIALLLNTRFPPGRMLFCLGVCVGVCRRSFVYVCFSFARFISFYKSRSFVIKHNNRFVAKSTSRIDYIAVYLSHCGFQ